MAGGTRTGAGRKPSTAPKIKTLNIRLTEAEHKLILSLGGSAWVREALEREKRPSIHISETKIKSVELIFNAKALKSKPEVVEGLLMDSLVCINDALLSSQHPDGL